MSNILRVSNSTQLDFMEHKHFQTDYNDREENRIGMMREANID